MVGRGFLLFSFERLTGRFGFCTLVVEAQRVRVEAKSDGREMPVNEEPTVLTLNPGGMVQETAGEVAEPVGGRKVMSIWLEFEIGSTKAHSVRLRRAYQLALVAATNALKTELLSDVTSVTSRMTYGYRHLEGDMITWHPNGIDLEEDSDDEA